MDSKNIVEISDNKIISAVAIAIKKELGEENDIPIYKEKDLEELTTPRIFLWNMNSSETERQNIKFEIYGREQLLLVRYHPDESSTTKNEDCLNFANFLTRVLRRIKVDGAIIVGKNINYEIVDDLLKVYVTYPYRVIYPLDKVEKMGTLQENYGIKNKGE